MAWRRGSGNAKTLVLNIMKEGRMEERRIIVVSGLPEGLGLGSLRRLTTSAGGLPGGESDIRRSGLKDLFWPFYKANALDHLLAHCLSSASTTSFTSSSCTLFWCAWVPDDEPAQRELAVESWSLGCEVRWGTLGLMRRDLKLS